jgi:hypothetical protein
MQNHKDDEGAPRRSRPKYAARSAIPDEKFDRQALEYSQ